MYGRPKKPVVYFFAKNYKKLLFYDKIYIFARKRHNYG